MAKFSFNFNELRAGTTLDIKECMKNKLLFVTKASEDAADGLQYAAQLASTMQSRVKIILIKPEGLGAAYERLMASITFAEEGQHATALQMLDPQEHSTNDPIVMSVLAQCKAQSIEATCKVLSGDPVEIIRTHIDQDSDIEIVLLSPSLSEQKGIRKLIKKKLLRSIQRPIVTIRRLEGLTT